jgi:NAD(P)-dependent dehydrogenase (short-subunit alcohol dehydrogenase family)
MGLESHSEGAVAIVTGGSSPMGRAVALSLARGRWSIVIVYLDQQAVAEATVEEIVAVGGTTVAVRADLADEFDVERVFTETIAAFGDVEVVVDTTSENLDLLCAQAARYLRQDGLILIPLTAQAFGPRTAGALRERGVTVRRVLPWALTMGLNTWR